MTQSSVVSAQDLAGSVEPGGACLVLSLSLSLSPADSDKII